MSKKTGEIHAGRPQGSEKWLQSRDHTLFGRADYLDSAGRAVVDYKSGHIGAGADHDLTDAEARQLRFYAHLAAENGVRIVRGIIIRSDGRRAELEITDAEAASEGQRARATLHRYQQELEHRPAFEALASASEEACVNCECIPLCEPFWQAATPDWSATCGVHVEGIVQECDESVLQGTRLVRLRLSRTRGTVDGAEGADVALEHVPAEWLELDSGRLPIRGDLLRLVHARASGPSVLRADKAATLIWQVDRF